MTPANGTRVAFCVESVALTAGDESAALAAGLARTLRDHGWDAYLVPASDWANLDQSVDVIVGCSARFSPVDAPGGPIVLGWATDLRQLIERSDIAAFDGLLVPSRLAVDRLARLFSGPVTALLPAVDARLFPAGDAVIARQGTFDAAARPGAPLDKALRQYGNAVAVRCESPPGHREFGVVPLTLLHVLAAGALPVATSALGLREMGLDDVEVASDPAAMDAALAATVRQPDAASARAHRMRTAVWERHLWRHRMVDLTTAIDAAKAARARISATIGYFPNYAANPYQRMLYAQSAASGVRVVPIADPSSAPVVRDDGKELDRQVLHIQWTGPLLQVATGPFDAARRLETFKESVSRFRARGGRVLWTIHNVLPHEVRFQFAEIELCEFLARSADRIHVLGEETLAAAEPHYELPPEKVVVIPHASYIDIYPDWVGREEARRRMGLEADEIALLLFGVIRPYKGLDMLLDVFDRVLQTDARLRLLVAGQPSASPSVDIWRERCASHPRIISALRYIDPSEVQLWMRAADLVILPYTSVLNSGALHLALTFGRPVVAPAVGVVPRQVDPSFATTFRPGDADSMVAAIHDAVKHLVNPDASAAARAAAERYTPADMSRDFSELVGSVVG